MAGIGGTHPLDVSAEQVGDPRTRALVRNLLHLGCPAASASISVATWTTVPTPDEA